jgi:TonB family protein
MAWVPKVVLALSAGIAAAQQPPVVVDPEDELLSMLQEWRQQHKGNNGGLPAESSQGTVTAAQTSAMSDGCTINGRPQSPCPSIANTTRRNQRTPVILSALQPEYPPLAAASAIRGRVIVLVTVDENGIPRDLNVISLSATNPAGELIKGAKTFGFEQAALAAVRKWIFAPGFKDGAPTSAKLIVEVNFPPQILNGLLASSHERLSHIGWVYNTSVRKAKTETRDKSMLSIHGGSVRVATALLAGLGLTALAQFALAQSSTPGPATVAPRAQSSAEGPRAPEFEYLGTLRAETGTRTVVENGPQGTRTIVQVVGGRFEGPRLKASVQTPAGDWITNRADGTYRLDVRLTLKTDDGGLILVTYNGIGQTTNAGASLRIAPLFETGDPRYVWLTRLQAVGVGERSGTTVKYNIYALK